MFGSTPVVKNIVALNIGIYILQYLTNGEFYDISTYLSLYDYRSEHFYPWQFVSYMFIHSGKLHLFLNMLPIMLLGSHLERLFGQKKFLLFYLLVGTGAGVAYHLLHAYEINQIAISADLVRANLNGESIHNFINVVNPNFFADHAKLHPLFLNYISHPNSVESIDFAVSLVDKVVLSVINTPLMGASGAAFGVLMAAALYFPNKQLFLIPLRFKWIVLLYVILLFRATEDPLSANNVAHFAHLSGMLFALLFYIIWKRKSFTTNQTDY